MDDADAEALGTKVGALEFVSHCYLRQGLTRLAIQSLRHDPCVSRQEVESKRVKIANLLGPSCTPMTFSTRPRILKKTGVKAD